MPGKFRTQALAVLMAALLPRNWVQLTGVCFVAHTFGFVFLLGPKALTSGVCHRNPSYGMAPTWVTPMLRSAY